MNAKSLSPRNKPVQKKPKAKKISIAKNLKTGKNSESVYTSNSPSVSSFRLNSKLCSSSPKLSLKLQSPNSLPIFNISTQLKLKAIAEKFSSNKTVRPKSKTLTEDILPLPTKIAVQTFLGGLNAHEIEEMLEYKTIYYAGLKAKKLTPNDKLKNKGFDTKDTNYMLVIGDHIAFRYEIQDLLGFGSFSQVCKCFDHKNKKEVAVKVIKSHKRFEEQGKIELKILKFLKKNDRSQPSMFVQMLNHFVFRKHLCIVFELMSFNLYDLLKANCFKGFSSTLVRRFATQVLNGMATLKKCGVIHCDLKPENIILVSPDGSSVKIIDLGSACFQDEKIYTYIQSRIYRSPEVILGIPYTTSIDMWSLGCIISELLTGSPLFQGDNEADQLFLIMEVFGYPPEAMQKQSPKRSKFFNNDGTAKIPINSKGQPCRIPGKRTLQEKIRTDDIVYADFIRSKKYIGCLTWEPEKRFTPEEALAHPWLMEIRKTKMIKIMAQGLSENIIN